MKNIFLIFLYLFSFLSFSQTEKKYVMLDSLVSKYDVKKYTLNTKKMYGFDGEIQMYNIFGAGIILFSVLPDLYKQNDWLEISLKDIEKEIFTKDEFNILFRDLLFAPQYGKILPKIKTFNHYKLIKKEDKKYFVCNYCLFEYFKEVNFKPPLRVSGADIINLKQDFFSILQLKSLYLESVDTPIETSVIPFRCVLETNYLSKIELNGGNRVYRFWFFTDNHINDWYNEHRGIERFAYIPKKGIVGGSYDFYFSFKNNFGSKKKVNIQLTSEQWKEYREQEKIMWSRELFPQRQ